MRARNKKIKSDSLSLYTDLGKLASLAKQSLAVLLILGLNVFALSPFSLKVTNAYFFDYETSYDNTFTTGTLDFRLTKNLAEGFVGKEHFGEFVVSSVLIPQSGSMPMQYRAHASTTSSVCTEIILKVKQNESIVYQGSASGFETSTTTDFGTWTFELDLPVLAEVTHGEVCDIEMIYDAWRAEIEKFEESGFFDTEILALSLRTKTIVLNEVLAKPNTTHSYPANREFVEIKNNGNAPVDMAGWKISETTSSGNENKRTIVATGGTAGANMLAVGGSTVVAPGGYLVLVFIGDASYLNDSGGETVRLYDAQDNLIDSYNYTDAILGKSDARYPDGIGAWIDPIPTPGSENILEDNLMVEMSSDDIPHAVLESDLNSDNLESETTPTELIDEDHYLSDDPEKKEEMVEIKLEEDDESEEDSEEDVDIGDDEEEVLVDVVDTEGDLTPTDDLGEESAESLASESPSLVEDDEELIHQEEMKEEENDGEEILEETIISED